MEPNQRVGLSLGSIIKSDRILTLTFWNIEHQTGLTCWWSESEGERSETGDHSPHKGKLETKDKFEQPRRGSRSNRGLNES